MEFSELTAYDVPAGVLTAWLPSVEPSAWADDDRALSPGHLAHLSEGDPGSWLGGVLRIPARYDEDALRRALLAWLARHEGLRTTAVGTGECGGWRRRTVLPAAVRLEAQELGALDALDARTRLAAVLGSVGPFAWPHCVFATVVDPAAEGFTLAFSADPSVMDAHSQVLWFAEVVELYGRALSGLDVADLAEPVEGRVASAADHADAEHTIARTLDVDSTPVARWRAFLTDGAGLAFPRLPGLPAGRAGELVRQRSHNGMVADEAQAQVFGRLCDGGGLTLQAGVLAALAETAREQHGIDRLRFVLPVPTRYSRDYHASVGSYVGFCPVDVDLRGVTGLATVGHLVQDVVASACDLAAHPYARVAELLEVSDRPRFVVSFVDSRACPAAGEWDRWQARALRGRAFGAEDVELRFERVRGGIHVAARYPGTGPAQDVVRDLLGGIGTLLEEVTRPHLEHLASSLVD
jgi:mycolipenoyl-CoA---2-(long-chain-fatty acyl)-trehalose mycolipenoyltransferase / long-chain-acyl-CoA---trehalose acyltransferase